MKLVIGGHAQGKLEYVRRESILDEICIWDAKLPTAEQIEEIKRQGKTVIVDHFHEWMRTGLLQENNPETEILEFVNKMPNCIVISDEIGNGIVPIDKFEREYRERTGRILVRLAKEADEVIRVICGIGQKIK